MERKYNINIPEPCHENWNKMTPNENGSFCLSCSKSVIDFTSMLPDEIQQFFVPNQSEKICKRFRKSQLESVTIQIPRQIFYSQTNYRKMFLLALFVAMGTTLFSCADKNGKKNKLDKIEVVTSSKPTEPTIDKNDTIHNVVLPKVDQVKFVNPKKTDKSVCVKKEKTNSKKKPVVKEPIYVSGEVVSETNAEFPGGIEEFYNYFTKEFKVPENIDTPNSKIKLSFAVEKNGSVSYLESVPSIDKTLENEIIRVLKSCPKWQPGQSDGKRVKRQYSLPITLQ